MANHRILLVEDSAVTQALVSSALAGVCQIDVAASGAQALEFLAHSPYDLILLDVKLPDADGFELYNQIRNVKNSKGIPILFLTAQGELEQKVKGFALGADDYIVKPFDLVEFHARVSAKLRNLELMKRSNVDQISVGPFSVNLQNQRIVLSTCDGNKELELTSNQFKVLYYLLRHEGKMVTREDLLREIWGDKVHVSDRTIDTHVYAIRQQIGSERSYLKSVHGKGYILQTNPSSSGESA